jgi:SOS-response transcriptional repressor LexA
MKSVQGLTPRQRKCLDFIAEYIKKNKCSPSYDDIATAMEFKSKQSVFDMIRRLRDKGHIAFVPGYARSITLDSGEYVRPKVTVYLNQRGEFISADAEGGADVVVVKGEPKRRPVGKAPPAFAARSPGTS